MNIFHVAFFFGLLFFCLMKATRNCFRKGRSL
jgi:hypothetical protein